MEEHIFYYRFNSEIFGVLDELDDKLKVESLQNRKTYDIDKDWISGKIEDGVLEISKEGLFDEE